MVPGKTIAEKLYRMERYGFEGVEVWGSDITSKLDELKSSLPTSKIKFSTICGFPGDLLGADRRVREEAMKTLREMLRICAELDGVGVITVPTFGRPKIPDLYPWYPKVEEIERKILIEEFKILGEYAGDVGAYIILEPINRYETHFINRLSQAVEVCKDVNMEYVKMMADFFHMNIEEADIPSSLEEAADFIVHIHLADSNRLLPGYGHTDFGAPFKVLRRVGYKNFMALECRVPGDPDVTLPKCVEYLRRFM